MLLDDDGNPIAGVITYTVYDENDASFATGTMSAVSGVTGLYTMSFTPDAAGAWSVLLKCSSPNRTAVKMFDVGVGVEQDTYDAIVLLSAALTTHDTDIKVLLAVIQADLDAPNQYKADISALALEATLTAIKGGGWTNETLKAIKDAIDALNDLSANDVWTNPARTLTDPNSYKADVSALALEATLNTHDVDIKLLIAALNDIAAVDVWNHASRTLTAHIFPFTNPAGSVDLSNLQTAAYTRLGAPVGASISVDIAAIKTVVDAIEGFVDTEVAAIKSETDKIPRIVTHMDFKSLPLQITLTSVAGDRGLVDIVVSGLPAGVTIIAVEGIFYCDTVENTFDGVNYLESTKIQVKEETAGTDRDAITLEANKIFRFTAKMVRGGTVLTADWATATAAGILAEVDGNGTYQMWFDMGETVQNNIVLDGAVFMLRIWFSV